MRVEKQSDRINSSFRLFSCILRVYIIKWSICLRKTLIKL